MTPTNLQQYKLEKMIQEIEEGSKYLMELVDLFIADNNDKLDYLLELEKKLEE